MIPLVTIKIAAEKIGTLPSLEQWPNHSNICTLDCILYDRLEAIPSPQSPEWGFCGPAEQPLEYGLKLQMPWLNANDPGEHQLANGTLTICDQSDADAIFAAEAWAFQSQSNIQMAIIAALNHAIPKRFKRSDTVGAQNYKNNQIPRDIITQHLQKRRQMKQHSTQNGTQLILSKHFLTGSKTASSPRSLQNHHSPSHNSSTKPSMQSNEQASTTVPLSAGMPNWRPAKFGKILRCTSSKHTPFASHQVPAQ